MKLNFDELIKEKTINLWDKGLNDGGLDILYKVIEQSTVLETLTLGFNNQLTLSDGKLANAIAKNTTLKILGLSGNNINPQGIKHLATALKKNNTVKELSIWETGIGNEGAKCLAEILAVNKTLQRIGLNSNNIGNKGAQSLATSLVLNASIHTIYLNDKITDVGAVKLADALETNHNIKHLHIVGNNISNHTKERIKAILNDDKRGDKSQSSLDKLELYIAKKEAAKNEEIAKKDEKLKSKGLDIARKDNRIATLEGAIRGQLQQLESILDPVDLTTEDESAEPPNKRARTEEETSKSTLAVQHESIKEAVKVKEENISDYVSFLQRKIDELASVAEAGGADKDKVADIKGRLRLNFDEFVSATAMANMS